MADSGLFDAAGSATLHAVVDTQISPELVPATESASDGQGGSTVVQPEQKSEDTIGPYELQDFHLYYILRFGFRPSKVAFLAYCAWHDRAQGRWPQGARGPAKRIRLAEIRRHLRTFLWRFFKTSQFKRSCVPNGPKVGSGGSLSPRGDWRAPSDSEATAWIDELEKNVPDDERQDAVPVEQSQRPSQPR